MMSKDVPFDTEVEESKRSRRLDRSNKRRKKRLSKDELYDKKWK